MLTISARLLHGTIRAGSPDDIVMAGGDPVGEWPPSPARLFSALVAADGTGDRCRFTDGTELIELEKLGPPTVFADVPDDVINTTLESRFVVRDVSKENVVQNYPGRVATLVHPGVVAAPRHPVIDYVWDVVPSAAVVEGLARRAARVGYLGCSDSPVALTVSVAPHVAALPAWTVGPSGVGLPVPFPGFLAALDSAFDAWSSGTPAKRSWVPTRRVRYSASRPEPADSEPSVIWLKLSRPQPARRALLIAETVRAALLSGVDAELSGNGGAAGVRAPWVLHGHDVPSSIERPYQLARVLPLPHTGYRHSDGAIHGVAVWLPPGTDSRVTEGVRAALSRRVRHLHARGLDVGVELRRDEAGAWSSSPRRWRGPARSWFSVTPAVAERGRRRGATEDDVRRWFLNAGHPEPDEVRISPVPTRSGVARLKPTEVHRSGKDRHPYYWLEVAFDEPVTGPLCVGRSRTFGMGLLAPEDGVRDTTTKGQAR